MSDRPIIRVQHIVKSFGSVTAVNDVSFHVRAGEIFAFLGPNGAGKTTTIKMLTTLLHPTSGSLELDGLDVTTHRTEVRKRFGVVFQDPSLDSELTAWENMDIHGVLYHVPRHARRERCEVLLRMFELWDRRADLVKTFSGGMKRRLEIARGLRGLLTGNAHFGVALDIAVLLAVGVVFVAAGAWRFSRIEA